MKLRLFIYSLCLCAGLFAFSPAAISADLTLDAAPVTGYYFSDGTISSADTSCDILENRKVECISPVVALRPGFSVKIGARFGVINGSSYADIPNHFDIDEDELKDWWEIASFGDIATQTKWTDDDNDGASDVIEFMLGTEPDNPNDRPDTGDHFLYDAEGRVKNVIRVP